MVRTTCTHCTVEGTQSKCPSSELFEATDRQSDMFIIWRGAISLVQPSVFHTLLVRLIEVFPHAGATLFSFVAAMLHFLIEVAMFKTMSLKAAANPMIIAGKRPAPYSVMQSTMRCMGPVTQTKSYSFMIHAMCSDPVFSEPSFCWQGCRSYGWEQGGITTPINQLSSQSKPSRHSHADDPFLHAMWSSYYLADAFARQELSMCITN